MGEPIEYTAWRAALAALNAAMRSAALDDESPASMEAWDDADAAEQSAWNAWADCADEHELCLDCAQPSDDTGTGYCATHYAERYPLS